MRCQCIVEFGKPVVAMTRETMTVSGTEVLLRMVANGVCHTDLHIREGNYNLGNGKKLLFTERGMSLPIVMGHEPVGVIEAAGADAGPLDQSKTYVIYPWQGCGECTRCKDGYENLCDRPRFLGVQADGGYAEYVKIPHPRYLFDIGDIKPEQAAPLACSGLTTFSALKKVEHTLRASPPVIIGAGGLGLMAIGLVKALGGLPPVVADISPAKREAAWKAGASAVVDANAPDAHIRIQEAAGGRVLAAIDLVGSELSAMLGFNTLSKGGTLVMVGLFGGAAPWPLPLIPVKAVSIVGNYTGSLPEFAQLMELVRAGKVPMMPVTTYPLEDANHILDRLESGDIIGRAVLTP